MTKTQSLPHWVLLVVLLADPAFAVTTIKSLPFQCTIPGETYVLADNLSLARGNAITILADDVVLDGNGKTLSYANNGPGYAIYINTNTTRLEVKNITLLQGAYDPADGERVHAIFRTGDYIGIKIHNNTIHVNHGGRSENASGHAIHLVNNSARSTGTEIFRNKITVAGTSGGYGISLEDGSSKIYDNTIILNGLASAPAGYARAIAVGGRKIEIRGNNITLDAKSDTIQGISLWGARDVSIHDNRLTVAANHARAILIDGNSDNNRIFNNQIDMISQHNNNADASAGIRIRFGSDNNRVYANTINAMNARNSFAVRLGGDDTRDGRFPDLAPPANNIIYNNTLTSSSRVISLEDNGTNTHFHHNIITAGRGGSALYLNGSFQNTTFSFDRISGPVRFQDGDSNTLFCSTTLNKSDISVGHGTHTYQISDRDCPDANTGLH